ncbi:Proteophosphoglycan ppg4 [Rhodotorula toruloides ATCC 204091]|uniref:Proteophosphoglycan ppg4 n=1 Tax=Rhodotorula toruloides TaxID=5286 RepID=A0A2T0ACX3_RHOTO|nr:Proteophosphoglycan ppg4 [Rhodotorula toruloides ATCC 204091]PRQ75847.1 Proteophosphoglycan ppg4 [Rhodotorula toruloides]
MASEQASLCYSPECSKPAHLPTPRPAQPKRERKKTVLIDPIVPRRASLESKGAQKGVKRRRSSGASDGDKVDVKRVAKEKRDKGKKRARKERDEEQDEEDSFDADTPSVRSYTRTVPRAVLATRWTTLSCSAREDLRYEVEQAGRSTLDALGSHSSSSAQNLKALFSSFADDLDILLSTLPVPPLPSVVASSSKNGKGKQVVLGAKLEEGEMERKISLLETALGADQADVEALSSRVDDEKRLLKREEKLLEQFIEATTEARDGRKEDLERKARRAKGKGRKRIKTSLEAVEARQSDDEDGEEADGAGAAAKPATMSVVERVEEALRRLGRAAEVGGGGAEGSGGRKVKKRRKVSEE